MSNRGQTSGGCEGGTSVEQKACPHCRTVRDTVARLLLCLATAVTISATAYVCAWYEYRNHLYFWYEQFETRQDLEHLRKEIERHLQTTGALPAKLEDLEAVK